MDLFCYYCIGIVTGSTGIKYTYTQTVGGTTNGVITTLTGLPLVLQIVNGILSGVTSYAFTTNNANATPVGVIAETEVSGTVCCRFHAQYLRAADS